MKNTNTYTSIVFLLLVASCASLLFMNAHAQTSTPADLSKHNPKDVCTTGKNAKDPTQTITYCTDIKTKKKYIPSLEPVITTDIISNLGSNSSSLVSIGSDNTSKAAILESVFKAISGTAAPGTGPAAAASSSPPELLYIDMKQLCHISLDKNCEMIQNNYNTMNLTTAKNTKGDWNITGDVLYTGSAYATDVKAVALFYDAKGVNIGGSATSDLNPNIITPNTSASFDIKTTKSSPKVVPVFFTIMYQGGIPKAVPSQNDNNNGQGTPTPPVFTPGTK